MSKKKFWLILMTTVLLVSIWAIGVFATGEPALDIQNRSVSLDSAMYMNFKVMPTNVAKEDISLLIWTAPQASYTKGTEELVLLSDGTDTKGREVFVYKNMDSRKMTDVIYARAYANVGGKDIYSAPVSFSVREYAYRIEKRTDMPENLHMLIKDMLYYGASAQTYFDYHTDFPATADVAEVKTVGAALSDHLTSGVYQMGSTVTVTANAPAEGMEFSHFTNAAGVTVSLENTMTASVKTDETYTAVYKKAESATGKLEYTVNADGTTCAVSGIGTYSGTDIVIPSEIDGYTVTGIADSAFYDNMDILSVTVPGSVKVIAMDAFSNCISLNKVTLLDGVTTIGDYAFEMCESLVTVQMPDSVTSIGESAFEGCYLLSDIAWPQGLQTLGDFAFYGCESLTSVAVSGSVTELNASVFSGCTGIRQAVIGSGITRIYDSAFKNCTNLETVLLPNTLTKIGNTVFRESTKLTKVFFGGTVVEWNNIVIGSYNGTLESSVCFFSETEPITDGSFWHYVDHVPTMWEKKSGFVYRENPDGTYAVIGVTNYHMPNFVIPSVVDGHKVVQIAEKAFAGNRDMVSVTIPEGITEIHNMAFANCQKLTAVSLPESMVYLGTYSFRKTAITEITVPKNVQAMGANPFAFCTQLQQIAVSPRNTFYRAESGCLINIAGKSVVSSFGVPVIPNGVIAIGESAFEGADLDAITLPEGITEIGSVAFSYTNIPSVTIPASVTVIGENPFAYCDNLSLLAVADENTNYTVMQGNLVETKTMRLVTGTEDGIIPDGILVVGKYAFANKSQLTSIIIPDSVTALDICAFADCINMQSMVWPVQLTVEKGAIMNCRKLKTVYYKGTVPEDSANLRVEENGNEFFKMITIYLYSEAQPDPTSRYIYWHFVNGIPTFWE